MFPCLRLLLSIFATASITYAVSSSLTGGRQTIRDLRRQTEPCKTILTATNVDLGLLYPVHNITMPIDHFHNESRYEPHTNGTFNMRYWFDATYYNPGGPVIVLQAGETDGAGRLPYLQKGILNQLVKATHGIGVVLEHRYYGKSFPMPDLSTKNMRFLTTQQALADEAYFAQNVQYPGLEKYGDLTSRTTAYIGYGGSYAGAFNAFLRVLYPNIFWGAISSSGVTKAIYDYWEYYDPIAQHAPQDCIITQKTFTHIVDNILIGRNNSELTAQLKLIFGMPNVTYDNDFADQLARGISWWQSLNWDPMVSNDEFYRYCANITDKKVQYTDTEALRSQASMLIERGGYETNQTIVNQFLNFIGYINLTVVTPCAQDGMSQDECFSNHNASFYRQDDLAQAPWRSWPYQYCTEWGYLQTGSGVPKNQLPLLSRTIDISYEMIICNEAFEIYNPPNTTLINQYGGYNISYSRLAFIDGEWDPWLPATPHAFEYGAKERVSTSSEPFILIANAVHHWDENGLFSNETTSTLPPGPVADTQRAELQFVKEWMQEWKLNGHTNECSIYGCSEELQHPLFDVDG